VFRGPISISTSERIGDPESRWYFAVVEAGKQKIVLDIGDDAELAKKVKYYSVPRHGDTRIQVAHVKGRLEFCLRTDDQARPGDREQPHLIVKKLDVYLARQGTFTPCPPRKNGQ